MKTYFLCDMSSQRLFNLYERIKKGQYESIMVFDRKYYDDKHYSEVDIALYNTRESMKYIIDNIIDIDFNGVLLKDNLLIHGYYIKVW